MHDSEKKKDIHIGGKAHVPRFSDGMWRLDIGGNHFCSETEDGLFGAVGHFHAVQDRERGKNVPPPAKDWIAVIRDREEPLVRKQEAYRHILRGDDAESQRIAATLSSRVLSLSARKLAEQLGKVFAFVTPEEMTAHVHDLVLRHRLLLELAELYADA
jgi:hypothetical protein